MPEPEKTPNTTENARLFLEALANPSKPLTYWEQDVVIKWTNIVENGGLLTDAQFAKLEQIYVEKTP